VTNLVQDRGHLSHQSFEIHSDPSIESRALFNTHPAELKIVYPHHSLSSFAIGPCRDIQESHPATERESRSTGCRTTQAQVSCFAYYSHGRCRLASLFSQPFFGYYEISGLPTELCRDETQKETLWTRNSIKPNGIFS